MTARILLGMLTWAVLVAPALCSIGVLEHACECGETESCGHEGSCPDDPCSLFTPERFAAGRAMKASLEILFLSGTVPSAAPIGRFAGGFGVSPSAPRSASADGVSFPSNDIPLRI